MRKYQVVQVNIQQMKTKTLYKHFLEAFFFLKSFFYLVAICTLNTGYFGKQFIQYFVKSYPSTSTVGNDAENMNFQERRQEVISLFKVPTIAQFFQNSVEADVCRHFPGRDSGAVLRGFPDSYRWPPYLATQSILPCTEGTGCARGTIFRFLAVGMSVGPETCPRPIFVFQVYSERNQSQKLNFIHLIIKFKIKQFTLSWGNFEFIFKRLIQQFQGFLFLILKLKVLVQYFVDTNQNFQQLQSRYFWFTVLPLLFFLIWVH